MPTWLVCESAKTVALEHRAYALEYKSYIPQ